MDTQPSWWQCVRHRIGMLINPPDTKKDVGLLYGEFADVWPASVEPITLDL